MKLAFIIFWLVSGIINILLSIPFFSFSVLNTDEFDILTPQKQKKTKNCAFAATFFCIFSLSMWVVVLIMFPALFISKAIELFPLFCAAYCPLAIFSWSVAVAESVKARYYLNSWKASKKDMTDTQASWRSLVCNDFCGKTGVVLGQKNNAKIAFTNTGHSSGEKITRKTGKLICFSDGKNSCAIGPTGAGKTSGISIPTAMSWQGNLIVFDKTGSIASATAYKRCKFSSIHVLSSSARKQSCYNPLSDIPDGNSIEKFGIRLASAFFSLTNENAFYNCVSARVFSAAAIHIALTGKYKKANKNLVYVMRILEKQKNVAWKPLIKEMLDTRHVNSAGEYFEAADDFIKQCVSEVEFLDGGTLQDAAEYLHHCLRPLHNKSISETLLDSDFSLRDFFTQDNPATLYISPAFPSEPGYQDSIVICTMYLDILITLIEDYNEITYPRTLMLLDDFTSLRCIPELAMSMNILQFKRVSFLITAQSISQINNIFGSEERAKILNECDILAIFRSSEFSDAEKITALMNERIAKNLRYAFNADSIMTIPFDSILILRKNARHYLAKKILWFDDPRFMKSPAKSDRRSEAENE